MKVLVDIEKLDIGSDDFVEFAKDIPLTFEDSVELNNRNLERAFEVQHPKLFSQLAIITDGMGFSFTQSFICVNLRRVKT